MLIARAPVRISFAGGGTDLSAYFQRYGGMVVSTTIDKYLYVVVNFNGQSGIQVTSSDYRTFCRRPAGSQALFDTDLALPLTVVRELGVDRGLSIFVASEVPPGTGLGSSSAVAVALVKALGTVCRRPLTKDEVARLACRVEIDELGTPSGMQDQYASAFGGLNAYYFGADGTRRVEPVRASRQTLEDLEKRLALFFTGSARKSSEILTEQKESSERGQANVIESLHAIKAAAAEVKACLEAGNLNRFGEILDETWQQKKRLARDISNPRIDEFYELARSKGALGGKITGAGGGGFLMLYCEEPYLAGLTHALENRGLRRMDFRFETGGAKVLFNSLPTAEMQVSVDVSPGGGAR